MILTGGTVGVSTPYIDCAFHGEYHACFLSSHVHCCIDETVVYSTSAYMIDSERETYLDTEELHT